MTRWASSTAQTAAGQLDVVMVTLVDLDFASGHVRAHDGVGDLSFGGNTYLGVGQYGGIEAVTEDLEIVARPLKLTLSGVDASLVSTTMTEVYQNRAATIYIGILNKSTLQFVDTPEEVWGGRMDVLSIEVNEGTAVITLSCEHRLRREPRIARYTDQDQQLAYSGDNFFNNLSFIPGYRTNWGSLSVTYSRPPGGPGVREPRKR